MFMQTRYLRNYFQEQREKVRLFLELGLQLARDGLHRHASDIKGWVASVEQRYVDFANRMEKLQTSLDTALGKPRSPSRDLSLDRHSDPTIEAKIKEAAKELSEGKRKSARRKELIIKELLTTEETYVQDLTSCIDHYLNGMLSSESIPTGIKGRKDIIFSNIVEIRDFHRNVFLKELEKYKLLPEDVGHCFLIYVSIQEICIS